MQQATIKQVQATVKAFAKANNFEGYKVYNDKCKNSTKRSLKIVLYYSATQQQLKQLFAQLTTLNCNNISNMRLFADFNYMLGRNNKEADTIRLFVN
jgi:ankyrin repeat protein